MTVPRERRYSIEAAREFLFSLLDPKKTPRVPRSIRREAYYRLKHFPSDYDMERAEKNFKEVFGESYAIQKSGPEGKILRDVKARRNKAKSSR